MRFILLSLAFLLACSVTANSSSVSYSSKEHLEAAIKKASIYLPKTSGAEWICSLSYELFEKNGCDDQITKKLPLVIHAHGCKGINRSDELVMKLYQKLGYVVFAPNSFALNRNPTCGSGNVARTAEIERALQLLTSKKWIDASRILVSGFSEGGLNAAVYRSDQIIGKIIMAYGCHRGGHLSPRTLNIVGSADRGVGNQVCSGAETVYLSNSGHDVFEDSESLTAIEQFIRSFK